MFAMAIRWCSWSKLSQLNISFSKNASQPRTSL